MVQYSTRPLKGEVETIARNFRFHTKSNSSSTTVEPSRYIEVLIQSLNKMSAVDTKNKNKNSGKTTKGADSSSRSSSEKSEKSGKSGTGGRVGRGVIVRVVERVSKHYHMVVVNMLDGAKKTEKSLQRMKKTAGNIAHMANASGGKISGSSGRSSGSGLTKIMEQVSCDIASYIATVRQSMLLACETCTSLNSLEEWLNGGLL